MAVVSPHSSSRSAPKCSSSRRSLRCWPPIESTRRSSVGCLDLQWRLAPRQFDSAKPDRLSMLPGGRIRPDDHAPSEVRTTAGRAGCPRTRRSIRGKQFDAVRLADTAGVDAIRQCNGLRQEHLVGCVVAATLAAATSVRLFGGTAYPQSADNSPDRDRGRYLGGNSRGGTPDQCRCASAQTEQEKSPSSNHGDVSVCRRGARNATGSGSVTALVGPRRHPHQSSSAGSLRAIGPIRLSGTLTQRRCLAQLVDGLGDPPLAGFLGLRALDRQHVLALVAVGQ